MKILPVRRVALNVALTCIFLIASSFQPAHQKRYSLRTVVIDAGHGGHDGGCVGSNSKEKDIALAIALKLGKYIENNFPDIKVIYTRKTDVFVELHERAAIANNAKADLFICIHCNSACYYDKKTKKVKCTGETDGVETWVMGLHKSGENLEVAKRENEVVLMEKDYQKKYDGFDPNSPEANIIFSLYQDTYLNQSLRFATLVQDELKKKGRQTRGVKQAGFIVLYRTYMPAILIETGFLSNKSEEKMLSSSGGQDEMAESVFNAFTNYKHFVESGETEKSSESTSQEIKTPEKPKIDSTPSKDTVTKVKIDSASLYPAKEKSKTKVDSTLTLIVKEKSKIEPAAENKKEAAEPQYYFTVQFLLSQDKLPTSSEKFKGVKNFREDFIDGVYKYTVGKCATFNEAVAKQHQMRRLGFMDAFIVAYKGRKRIPVNEARKALK
jgi:N-acetylmuramoyl-L-alanine amidase